jgi:transposase
MISNSAPYENSQGQPFEDSLVHGLRVDEANGRIVVEQVWDILPDDICRIPGITMARLGRFVYTDMALGRDSLVFDLPHRRWDCNQGLKEHGRLRHSRAHGFWNFVAEAMARRGWLKQESFGLALYEMQFRYNHREQDICDLIMEILLRPAPNAND